MSRRSDDMKIATYRVIEEANLRTQILSVMLLERARQPRLRDQGHFRWTLDEPDCPDAVRLACLTEELGEVARAMLGDSGAVTDGGDLEHELMQLGALTIAWLEFVVRSKGSYQLVIEAQES